MTGNKLWILDRETCVFAWIAEKTRSYPVPDELVIAGEVPVREEPPPGEQFLQGYTVSHWAVMVIPYTQV